MAQLAIKGHPTRGSEVIRILEMLGGKTPDRKLYGNVSHYGYYIYDNVYISLTYCSLLKNAIVFTLEEFEEKFPYKVGDKVSYKQNKKTYFIRKMFWEKDKILYELSDEVYSEGSSTPDTIIFDVDVIKLQPYKEETMEEKLMPKIDFNDYCKDKYLLDLGNYEIKEENGKTYVVRKQPQYPKTYEECCEVLGIDVSRTIEHEDCPFYKDVTCYENNLLSSLADLRKLLICRDAYWKIGGIPDVKSSACCCLYYDIDEDDVLKELGPFDINSILIFPTQEICDMFYDAFEELIKKCKSLI